MDEKPFAGAAYQEFLNEDKLMGSRCQKCGALFLPPRAICTECHSTKMEWIELKGRGKLAAFTCITVGPPFMCKEGYDRNHPYCIGVVELEEGVKVDARIEGVDVTKPETIKIGIPLTIEFQHRGDGEQRETILICLPSTA